MKTAYFKKIAALFLGFVLIFSVFGIYGVLPVSAEDADYALQLVASQQYAQLYKSLDIDTDTDYIVKLDIKSSGTTNAQLRVYTGSGTGGTRLVSQMLTDTDWAIKLWWCNGQGEPYLYSWSARSESFEVSGQVGFRTVKLLKNIGTMGEPAGFPKSRYSAPITVELNGRRIFAKGSNWVNPELFFGAVTYERYAELVKLAKEANMNILRIWGGSGICKDEFYSICDREGIMVWQEFMLACNNYEGMVTSAKLHMTEKIPLEN